MSKSNFLIETQPVSFIDSVVTSLAKAQPAKKQKTLHSVDQPGVPTTPLLKSILNYVNGNDASVNRLSFEKDPAAVAYSGIFEKKHHLLPDALLKRMMIQDDLVAAIVNTRANQIAAFGRPRPSRFDIGFVIEPDEGKTDDLSDEQKEALKTEVARVSKLLLTCGSNDGVAKKDRMSFSQFLYRSTKDAVGLGRIATEKIYATKEGQRVFQRFAPIDASTIHAVIPQKNESQFEAIRAQAKALLEALKAEKLIDESRVEREFTYVQVIKGTPKNTFTDDEIGVHNFYPTNDIDLSMFPVTPLDTVVSAVTTHINITTHNKMYFQTGRASRGMLVINSEDADENMIARLRQQFNASINGVGNSWKMPVFSMGPEDKVSWTPIDSGGRDMEFQYLSDTNARVILSAFQMSPEELPGYAHLSRGTANQALSESNQEYLLIAHRDVGIRPLLMHWQDYINEELLPLFSPTLAKTHTLKLVGLDAETAEKEAIRIQQDAPIHMTYNEILEKVEKKELPQKMGGDFPINPQWQAIVDKYLTVGEILEEFFGKQGASKDPQWAYVRDQFWFSQQQSLMQQQQMQQQAQQAQQQQQQQQGGAPQGGGGQPSGGGGGGAEASQQSANEQSSQNDVQAAQEISSNVDQAASALGKSEAQLNAKQKTLLARQRQIVENNMRQWHNDSKTMIADVIKTANMVAPKTPRKK